ncbi:MAG: methionyl-tRNA formyltransferase [Candidatus Pacebacteria bacterium]|nr:methionyl-tRNA formyltransferase [Candidatus Paceibacterota bacterium]
MNAFSSSFRLGFFGTPEFAAVVLQALIAAGIRPSIVFSGPPRPRGRGMELQPSVVAGLAMKMGLPTVTATDWRDPSGEARRRLQEARIDLAIVVAYGRIIPAEVLVIPPLGFVNLHASLLPRWRGAAPIQRAILSGDSVTGVGLMQMAAELDRGDILAESNIAIESGMTGGELHDRLAELAARLMLDNLPSLLNRTLVAVPQSEVGVTYAAKITKELMSIDWNQAAIEIDRQVRAFAPSPAAWTILAGERIKILEARVDSSPLDSPHPAGTIVNSDGWVSTGKGTLQLMTIQRAGKNPIAAAEWIKSASLIGKKFSTPESPS